MHVVGQHDPCVDVKRALQTDFPDGVAQRIDVCNEQIVTAFEQIDGEEVCPTANTVSAIVRHRCIVPKQQA